MCYRSHASNLRAVVLPVNAFFVYVFVLLCFSFYDCRKLFYLVSLVGAVNAM